MTFHWLTARDITPFLTHWSYISFALSHWYNVYNFINRLNIDSISACIGNCFSHLPRPFKYKAQMAFGFICPEHPSCLDYRWGLHMSLVLFQMSTVVSSKFCYFSLTIMSWWPSYIILNLSWLNGAIRCCWTGSSLVSVMARCLFAPT